MTAFKHLGGSLFEVIKCMLGALSPLLLALKTNILVEKVTNVFYPAEAVGRLESEKAAIHAEYEQVHILKKFVLSPDY